MVRDRVRFAAADLALLRVSSLPARCADPTRADLEPDTAGYEERLTSFLRTVVADPVLREAIEVSSGPLSRTLDSVERGMPVEVPKLRRAAFAVTRYLLRMSARPTPFGLFAGVAVAGFDSATKTHLGSSHRKGVRPDAAWLGALIARLEREPAVLARLRVTANDLCFVRNNRLVLPYLPFNHDDQDNAEPVRELSVRYTPPVHRAVALANEPLAFAELCDHIAAAFPREDKDVIQGMLRQLIERDVLLTDLQPSLSVADPLGHVLERLDGLDIPEVGGLREVADALATYAGQRPGEGREAWRHAVTMMSALQTTAKPPIQVDLRVDADVRLSRAVADEAERAGDVLWRLSSPGRGRAHLRQYHAAFLEHYGSHRLVPVRELLDAEAGLGPPADYRVPPSDRRAEPEWPDGKRSTDELLASLVQRATLAGEDELVLDDELVAQLEPSTDGAPPQTMELCFHVLAESPGALDEGDFSLTLSPLSGSPAAGAIFGRFAYLFDEGTHLTEMASAGYAGSDADARRRLPVQLDFRTVRARSTNVARVPTFLDHTLAVGTFAERSEPGVLGLDDVAVGADPDRLYLLSVSTGREIQPVSPHMLNNVSETPNAVRLLREIAGSGRRGWHPWWWADLAALPRLPRVRYGRTVLSVARWRPDPVLHDSSLPWDEWHDTFQRWRRAWGVPETVHVTFADNRVELDLDAPFHRQLLRQELSRHPDAVLTETPDRVGGGHDWLEGHASEIVVPLRRVDAAERSSTSLPPARVRDRSRTSGRRHAPGGEWIYAKLYCATSRHDEVLAGNLQRLLASCPPSIDRWFFLRYADPEPHLRLRFHGSPDELTATFLPALHGWATGLCDVGLARRLVLDTYEPEVERYGGPELLEAAERAFTADSEAVLAQLRLQERGILELSPVLLAAANHVDVLRAFGDPDWADWLLTMYPKDAAHPAFRARRREALRLIDPSGRWESLAGIPGGSDVLAAWRRRADVLAAYGARVRAFGAGSTGTGEYSALRGRIVPSLLHMQHNRLLGSDREQEQQSYAIARGAVRAHRDRVRFAS